MRVILANVKGTAVMAVFRVPFKYDCKPQDSADQYLDLQNACGQAESTPCWVQRPWEKQMFMNYMLFMSVVSVIICFCDLNYVMFKISSKRVHRRRQNKIVKNGLLNEWL